MKKILSLSLSIIEKDNRVIRQCQALSDAGFDVIAYGLPYEGSDSFEFSIRHNGSINKEDSSKVTTNNVKDLDRETVSPVERKPGSMFNKLLELNRKNISYLREKNSILIKPYSFSVKLIRSFLRGVSLVRYVKCWLGVPNVWKKLYWREGFYSNALEELKKLGKFDLIIANDWHMLPIANELCRLYGSKLVYDSHEHAISENNHILMWKLTKRHFLFQLEKECLTNASFIISVSQGIADALKKQYDLKCPCMSVRSTPFYHSVGYRPIDRDEKIKVYYHGYMKENRHLDTILRSLPLLGEGYELIYRGGHESSFHYEKILLELAKSLGVADRFHLFPMASHETLIDKASMGDIGLSVPPLNSLHSDMALPNKFFEYIMSGQAICVSPVKEMSHIVKENKLGKVVQDVTPEGIAKTISSLSIDDINSCKKNSIKLAKELCWEKEQARLVELVTETLR